MPSKETPRLVDLGRLLRELRTRCGLLQKDVADALHRNVSHVSRWESGKLAISEEELAAFLNLVEATSEETMEALRLHRDAADPNWLVPGIGRDLAVMREYEDAADTITNFQPLEIPGPLQTESYASIVIRGAGATDEQAADWLTFRMARRDSILSGAVHYEAIIGEQAIRYPSCGNDVATEQLNDLVKVGSLDHITIRVLPFRTAYHPGRGGSFVLVEAADNKPVVHLEHYRSSSTLTNSRDVRDYQDAAEALRRDALDPVVSARFIADVADKLESNK